MRTRFITSAADPAGFPVHDLPEVVFAGRSNVGKSSLLNRLANATIARTSKTPGRTQMINFFELHTKELDLCLADLPGYGFGQAPAAVRADWMGLIEDYLSASRRVAGVLVLFDLRRTPEPEDLEILRWVAEARSAVAVATKIDKLSKAKQKPALLTLAKALGRPLEDTLGVSSHSGQGIEALRARIIALALASNQTTRADGVGEEQGGRLRQKSLDQESR